KGMTSLEIESGKTVRQIGRQDAAAIVFSMVFLPDSQTLAYEAPLDEDQNPQLSLTDVKTGKTRAHLVGHKGKTPQSFRTQIFSVVIASDGSTLASGATDDTICIWDLQKVLKD